MAPNQASRSCSCGRSKGFPNRCSSEILRAFSFFSLHLVSFRNERNLSLQFLQVSDCSLFHAGIRPKCIILHHLFGRANRHELCPTVIPSGSPNTSALPQLALASQPAFPLLHKAFLSPAHARSSHEEQVKCQLKDAIRSIRSQRNPAE